MFKLELRGPISTPPGIEPFMRFNRSTVRYEFFPVYTYYCYLLLLLLLQLDPIITALDEGPSWLLDANQGTFVNVIVWEEEGG